jgi:hypothetical protein
MANNVSMSKFAPKPSGVRDPRDSTKKNGMFWNWPRYQYFGGMQQPFSQAGTKMIDIDKGGRSQDSTGPISDRGRGRG